MEIVQRLAPELARGVEAAFILAKQGYFSMNHGTEKRVNAIATSLRDLNETVSLVKDSPDLRPIELMVIKAAVNTTLLAADDIAKIIQNHRPDLGSFSGRRLF